MAWRSINSVLASALVLACCPLAAFAALPHTAADMDAAHGRDAIRIKDDLLAPLPSLTVIKRAEYATEVVQAFQTELTSANPDARLNTAILFASFESLACDHVYETMLSSKDPAVRLWGAKGLAAIASDIKKVGGATLTRATTALKSADAAESSQVVKDQIEKTLTLF
ncbi:MAG: hypothetical protein ACTHN5_01535 [Phycisphaerae bacterium]